MLASRLPVGFALLLDAADALHVNHAPAAASQSDDYASTPRRSFDTHTDMLSPSLTFTDDSPAMAPQEQPSDLDTDIEANVSSHGRDTVMMQSPSRKTRKHDRSPSPYLPHAHHTQSSPTSLSRHRHSKKRQQTALSCIRCRSVSTLSQLATQH